MSPEPSAREEGTPEEVSPEDGLSLVYLDDAASELRLQDPTVLELEPALDPDCDHSIDDVHDELAEVEGEDLPAQADVAEPSTDQDQGVPEQESPAEPGIARFEDGAAAEGEAAPEDGAPEPEREPEPEPEPEPDPEPEPEIDFGEALALPLRYDHRAS